MMNCPGIIRNVILPTGDVLSPAGIIVEHIEGAISWEELDENSKIIWKNIAENNGVIWPS